MPDQDSNAKPDSGGNFDVNAFVRSVVASAGSADSALARLGKDNMRYRRNINQLKEKLEAFQTRNPDGSIVLVGEQVTQWNAIKEILKTTPPDRIKSALEELPVIRGKLEEAERVSVVSSAAADLGYDSVVLADLIKTKGLQLVKADVNVKQEDGTTVVEKQWQVKEGDAAPVLIESSSAIKPYLPALKKSGTGDEGRDDGEDGNKRVVPEQRSSTKGSSTPKEKDLATPFIQSRRYATPSELAAQSKK